MCDTLTKIAHNACNFSLFFFYSIFPSFSLCLSRRTTSQETLKKNYNNLATRSGKEKREKSEKENGKQEDNNITLGLVKGMKNDDGDEGVLFHFYHSRFFPPCSSFSPFYFARLRRDK